MFAIVRGKDYAVITGDVIDSLGKARLLRSYRTGRCLVSEPSPPAGDAVS